MTLTLFCVASSIINAVTSFLLGIFVLRSNPRSKLHQLWAWMSVSITIWGIGLSVCFGALPSQYALALFALRVADTIAIFIPLFYLHFVIVFLGQNDRGRVLRLCYGVSFFLACFGFSDMYIPGIRTKMGIANFNDAGPLFWWFFALYIVEPLYAIYLMWRARGVSDGIRRAHVTLVMMTGIIGFFVGATWFPLCFNIPIPPIPGCFVWLYCLLVTWAVFKYHLFDIHVVIRRSLVYSILVTVLTVGYFGLVYGLERSFQVAFGYRSMGASLAAFALMALVFQPLKIGIQRVLDLLFFHAPQQAVAKKLEVYEQRAREGERYKAAATLAAGIAHELKNPLAAIQTFLDFFPQKHRDAKFREQFQEVVGSEVKRLQQVAQGLMDFSKPQAPQIKPVDVKQVVEETLALAGPELREKGLTIRTNYTHNGAVVQGDPAQLKQAFLNLILNARDAMEKGGALTIFTGSVNGHVEVHIADTGCGIHPKDLPHLFEPFFTKKEGGNGLGLSIVQSIIREHRGSIQVTTTLGKGTIFAITLPT